MGGLLKRSGTSSGAQAAGGPSDWLQMGVSVNVFFRAKDLEGLYKEKDAWANHDFPVWGAVLLLII